MDDEKHPVEHVAEKRRGYIIELPRDTYFIVKDNLRPAIRFLSEEWRFEHFWMYSPDFAVVIFAPMGAVPKRIRELEDAL